MLSICFARNGDTYAGDYFADKMHGYGVYKFANGHRYEGSWHDGRKQGLGIYTFRNGDTHAGHWHLGTLESRSTQVSNSSSAVATNHFKVLNAVQVLLHCLYFYSLCLLLEILKLSFKLSTNLCHFSLEN